MEELEERIKYYKQKLEELDSLFESLQTEGFFYPATFESYENLKGSINIAKNHYENKLRKRQQKSH